MSAPELLIGGTVAVVIAWAVLKGRARSRRAAAVAEIARLSASPVSLAGRVLWAAALIVAAQWVLIVKVPGPWVLPVVLAIPALITATIVVRALTATGIDQTGRSRRKSGGGWS